MIKLKLESDFKDYYDKYFDQAGVPFRRYRGINRPRAEILDFLQKIGLQVPLHGPVRKVYEPLIKAHRKIAVDRKHRPFVVVYHRQDTVRGQGCELLPIGDAMDMYPDKYCVEYIPEGPGQPFVPGTVVMKIVFIGSRSWFVRYTNENGWTTSFETTSVELLGEEPTPPWRAKIPAPLCSIDIVPSRVWQKFFSIDLDLAPKILGTGIERFLKPEEAAMLIKMHMDRVGPGEF